ncbi:MAG: DEAD/DEAH box helicase [Anaerolineales bacterium]|nr:DEAD/DEAH box helicase [Anaerolineales bacterium]
MRLEAANRTNDKPASLAYAVGDVWELEGQPADDLTPPHVENFVVYNHRLLRKRVDPIPAIERFMPPHTGGIEALYDGLLQSTASGALYVATRTGMPPYSTLFWRPDQPLVKDTSGKRIRYRYPTGNGGFTLTYVGLEPPLETLPAGTLLRVSLAHWWRADDKPEDELRCYVQLSGWYGDVVTLAPALPDAQPDHPIAVAPAAQPTATRAPSAVASEELLATLKRVFGYDAFRPHQEEIIRSSLDGIDTLAILPTGSGKSLCYQLPALLRDGLTVVVSPLIALMQDQVDALWLLGAPAAHLNSTVAYSTYLETVRQLKRGAIKLLYLAPETLLRPGNACHAGRVQRHLPDDRRGALYFTMGA